MTTTLLVSSCVTGPRPTLGPTTSFAPITDPAIIAVIDVLSETSTSPFSVTYDINTRYGDVPSSAEVVFDPSRGLAVRIQDVLFVLPNDDSAVTCTWSEEALSISECESGIDEARVSSLQLNSRIFKAAAVDRLRRDSQIASGPPVAKEADIAERAAVCVDVPVIDGSGSQQQKSYCAFRDLKIVASLEAADLTISAVFVDDVVTSTFFEFPIPDE